jgi:hypothetical protein
VDPVDRGHGEASDERQALRVPVDEATDVLCALMGLEVYALLSDRGWTSQRWQAWVTDAVVAALLR